MLIELLAVLSISAAAGIRIALPLLIVGFFRSNQNWSSVPILNHLPPQVIIGVLTSWSLFELLGSKKLLGQRVLQLIELSFSPLVGLMLAVTVVRVFNQGTGPLWLVGLIGGLFALMLHLVQVGWFFRLRGLPLWAILAEDFLCILLVWLAFTSPQKGGLIALSLLWFAVRSAVYWQQWAHGRSRSYKRNRRRKRLD